MRDIDSLTIDYDRNSFVIVKNGKIYEYDLDTEFDFLQKIADARNVEYEVYGQEEEEEYYE